MIGEVIKDGFRGPEERMQSSNIVFIIIPASLNRTN